MKSFKVIAATLLLATSYANAQGDSLSASAPAVANSNAPAAPTAAPSITKLADGSSITNAEAIAYFAKMEAEAVRLGRVDQPSNISAGSIIYMLAQSNESNATKGAVNCVSFSADQFSYLAHSDGGSKNRKLVEGDEYRGLFGRDFVMGANRGDYYEYRTHDKHNADASKHNDVIVHKMKVIGKIGSWAVCFARWVDSIVPAAAAPAPEAAPAAAPAATPAG